MSNKKNINVYLMEGNFKEAYTVIEESIGKEKKVDELLLQHRVIKYWMNHIDSINKYSDSYERGLAYFDEWNFFQDYLEKHKMEHSEEIDAIHYFVHDNAAKCFIKARNNKNNNDIDLLKKIAYCLKEISKYEESLEVLKYAYKLNKNAQILMMIADCYYLKGDKNTAKLFFREVFFFEQSFILNFSMISSDKIFEIIDLIKKNNWEEYEIVDWIPIYGLLTGFFDVRRELVEEEVKKIKKTIGDLEAIFYSNSQDKSNIVPILIKNYILLVEYFNYQNKDEIKFEQYFNKIKSINPFFYEKLKGVIKWQMS